MAITFFCQITLLFIFCWSAIGKLNQPSKFQDVIAEFTIIPRHLVSFFSWTIIVAEVTTIFLIIVSEVLYGFLLSMTLLTVFSIGLYTILRKRIKISCGCFGPGRKVVDYYDIYRNLTLILLCTLGIISWNRGDAVNLNSAHQVILTIFSLTFIIALLNISGIVRMIQQPEIMR